MIYKVIGLMSGSSLDGLDIAFVQLEEVRGQWTYQVLAADCVPYTEEWAHNLKHAQQMAVPDFLRLNTAYGRWMGEAVNKFITEKNIDLQVQFIASHGHTVMHEPANYTTSQIGDGAAIAAVTGLPVISDLRALDVALGGQGAPIVPIGDKLLFGQYDYHLNIGGIANITVQLGVGGIQQRIHLQPTQADPGLIAQASGDPLAVEQFQRFRQTVAIARQGAWLQSQIPQGQYRLRQRCRFRRQTLDEFPFGVHRAIRQEGQQSLLQFRIRHDRTLLTISIPQ